ncbi:MAG: hypothetical protein OXD49_11595 [Candidatus Poribacteria bacterium]|nr:hypothetical protein [Candidatus Poribacteria bacterium]
MKVVMALMLLVVFIAGCDQGRRMMDKAITQLPTVDTTEPRVETDTMPAQTMYSEITFENVLDLAPGRYRLIPNQGYAEGSEGVDVIIYDLSHGNVDAWGSPFPFGADIAVDAPKIHAFFELTKRPYALTPDGDRVIAFEPEIDEIVIEIVSQMWVRKETGGSRGNRFEYDVVAYNAILIENLTHPERTFEYE